MKLITTILEVQDHLPVQMTSFLDVVKPFVTTAERSHVLQLIGRNQFDVFVLAYQGARDLVTTITDPDVLEEYNNGTKKVIDLIPDATLREAISLCQKIATTLGYFYAIPFLSVKIGNTGIQVFSNQDTKQAFNWQIDDLKEALIELGYNATEELLLLLEQNADLFPEYINSEQYITSEQFLIESATDFTRYFNIGNSRYIFQSFAYIMRRIESQQLAPLFGPAFLEKLRADDLGGNIKILADDYLKPAIALITASKAIIERVITFQNGVASINLIGNYDSAKNNLPATKEDIQLVTLQLNADGRQFLQDGLQFVQDNLADFPDFVPIRPKSSYNIKNNPQGGIFAV